MKSNNEFLSSVGKPTYIDLFAGAGGLSVGFEKAGFKGLLAVEADKWAAETHAFNIPDTPVLVEDIRTVSEVRIRSLAPVRPDLIIGGPPCQGFSHANVVNKDPNDPRNSLFEDFLHWVEVLSPKICLIENVTALLKTKTKDGTLVIDVITSELERIGYKPSFKILDSKDFGVPQKRQRLFIIGIRQDLEIRGSIFPSPTHQILGNRDLFTEHSLPSITLWDAISDLPQVTWDRYHESIGYHTDPQNAYQEMMRRGATEVIHNSEPMRHTKRVVERFKNIGIGQSEGDVAESHMPNKRGNPTSKSAKKYSQNSRRQPLDQPCNAIVASSHTNFIHPILDRNFTVRELLRIQSFPDSFIVKGKRAVLSKKLSEKKGLVDEIYLDQRMQVGNAVPPLLAQAIAEHLGRILKNQVVENATESA